MADGDETRPGAEPPAEEAIHGFNQGYFLKLALQGKDAWNAWRRESASKDVPVTFEGIDFSVVPWTQSISRGSNSAMMRIFRDASGGAPKRCETPKTSRQAALARQPELL